MYSNQFRHQPHLLLHPQPNLPVLCSIRHNKTRLHHLQERPQKTLHRITNKTDDLLVGLQTIPEVQHKHVEEGNHYPRKPNREQKPLTARGEGQNNRSRIRNDVLQHPYIHLGLNRLLWCISTPQSWNEVCQWEEVAGGSTKGLYCSDE